MPLAIGMKLVRLGLPWVVFILTAVGIVPADASADSLATEPSLTPAAFAPDSSTDTFCTLKLLRSNFSPVLLATSLQADAFSVA